jgi:hypothetical protein
MKVKELKQFLDRLDDDFDIKLLGKKAIPQEQLDKMSYTFPYDRFEFELETGDIGYSSKIAQLWIDLDKPIDD